jgi:hypothetical protein
MQACADPAAADREADVEAAVTEAVAVPKDAGKRYSEVLLALLQLATAGFITPLPQVHVAVALHCNICCYALHAVVPSMMSPAYDHVRTSAQCCSRIAVYWLCPLALDVHLLLMLLCGVVVLDVADCRETWR